jgi:hypothetical protein
MNIILIQETMVEGVRARAVFESWLKNWLFCSLDADGQSGGLLTGWSPNFKEHFNSMLNYVPYSVSWKHKI